MAPEWPQNVDLRPLSEGDKGGRKLAKLAPPSLTFADAPKRAPEWSQNVDLRPLSEGDKGGAANEQN